MSSFKATLCSILDLWEIPQGKLLPTDHWHDAALSLNTYRLDGHDEDKKLHKAINLSGAIHDRKRTIDSLENDVWQLHTHVTSAVSEVNQVSFPLLPFNSMSDIQ